MGRKKKFYFQDSDESNMNRAPVEGFMPYGSFLKNMIYPDFTQVAMFSLDVPQLMNNQVHQLESTFNEGFHNFK